jgi:hypothetical protein
MINNNSLFFKKKFYSYLGKFLILIHFLIWLLPLEAKDQDILIKKYFKNRHTIIIICKGYSKPGTSGQAKKITAQEAALLNAQFIAQNAFNKTVNVFKNGRVLKYKLHSDYAVVYYQIYKWNLRNRLRKK